MSNLQDDDKICVVLLFNALPKKIMKKYIAIGISLIAFFPFMAFASTWFYTQTGGSDAQYYASGGSGFNANGSNVFYFYCPNVVKAFSLTPDTMWGINYSGHGSWTNDVTAVGGFPDWYTMSPSGNSNATPISFANTSGGNNVLCGGGTGTTITIQTTAPTSTPPIITQATSTYDTTCTTVISGSTTTQICDDPLKTQTGGLESFIEICILVFFGTWFIMWHGKKEIS